MVQMSPKAYVPIYAKRSGTSIASVLRRRLACARRLVMKRRYNLVLTFSCSQGSKIRAAYISFADKEQKRLEESIAKVKAELETRRREEITAKSILLSAFRIINLMSFKTC